MTSSEATVVVLQFSRVMVGWCVELADGVFLYKTRFPVEDLIGAQPLEVCARDGALGVKESGDRVNILFNFQ